MNRMGLIDFWYYTNEEFHFSGGHMLLRGGNGSGKSVTMQSLIPLLLDGNRSSERLDPFGTRARKMETYLLDESGKHEDRIGYLYLEFKKGESALYTTIGMGIRARKNRPLDTWYFVIEDNRRIGKELFLTDTNKTLTKQELKHRIGIQFIESQKQYMEKVNQVLFGFEHVLDYKETIDLLLQLRTPKLNNSFKPTILNEVLSQSLQPLSEDDLRDMSEAISNMDQLKSQLENLKESMLAASDIMTVYEKYNLVLLLDKLQKYQREKSDYIRVKNTITKNKNEVKHLLKSNEQLITTETELKQEQALLTEEKNALGHSDMIALGHDVTTLEKQITEIAKRLDIKLKARDQKEDFLMDKKNEVKKHDDELAHLERRLTETMTQLDDIHDEWSFSEHLTLKKDIDGQLDQNYNYDHTLHQLEEDLQVVTQTLRKFDGLKFYEAQLQNKEDAQERAKETLDTKTSELSQSEQLYQDIIEEYKETIAKWSDKNKFVNLDHTSLHQMIEHLLAYEETKNYGVILAIVAQIKEQIKDEMKTKLAKKISEKESVIAEIKRVESELFDWKTRTFLPPEVSHESRENRNYLTELMIPYVPLYEVLEFDETMTTVEINQIEEMLTRSGLLDAVLVEEKYRTLLLKQNPEKTDNYLFVKAVVSNELSIILSEKHTLVQAFKMLGVNDTAQLNLDENSFLMGVLEGNLSGAIPAKYIGAKAREDHRQKMMATLEQELLGIKDQLATINEGITAIEVDLQTVKEEVGRFPEEENLASALKIVLNIQTEMNQIQGELEKILNEMIELKKAMTPIREVIQQAATRLEIGTKEQDFIQIEELIKQYRQDLSIFIRTHQQYVQTSLMKSNANELMMRLTEEVDEIRFEIDDLSSRKKQDEGILQIKRDRLEELGFSDLRERLEVIDKRLTFIPEEIGRIKQALGSNLAILENLTQQLQADETKFIEQEERVAQYLDLLKQEVQLGLVVADKSFDLEQLEQLQKNSSHAETKDKIYGDLHEKFHTKMGTLQEYSITMTHDLPNPYPTITDVTERVLIVGKLNGKRVGFSELTDRLVIDKTIAEQILKDEDRKLFEDILITTVSKKIRARIKNSEQWVKKMNRHISEMNTSSGLKLQLVWKAHSAASDGQLDTKELVGLLMRDEHLLTATDKEKVSNHFRSKIELARDSDLNENITASFHQIMREVMDYRKWFTFIIHYQKSGEVKKELTNNRFSTFSGGEKAMAMYVPLFSAVAAKFDNAKPDSPVIIALDEAFAGVDENNIDAMFELIGKFDFDYIMNSQVLWGDYPSVKDLAIYELHRPNNANFVTTMQYHWNGHVKTYVS